MKAFIPYFCLIITLQLWACASQSDPFSFSQEKGVSKGEKDKVLPKEEVDTHAEIDLEEVVEEDPQYSDDLLIREEEEAINKKNKLKGAEKENSTSKKKDTVLGDSNNSVSVQAEDKIEALSIISYSNVIEAASADLPVQGQKVKLMIKNNHQQAMWYLMPVSGESTMPENGQFYANPEAIPPFLAKQYGTLDGKLIELIYHGKGGQSFRAFYIEAGSSLLFRNYDLGSYQEGEYVPFWAIKGLEVNNETSLEEWLPFSVASSPDVVIHNTTGNGTAKWVNASKDAVFPKSKIKFVQANGIKKYQIPVGVIR
ncbi:MAG: hypothetical protein ACI976_000056 [Aureispira sp.]|jgi:hypothetical protein